MVNRGHAFVMLPQAAALLRSVADEGPTLQRMLRGELPGFICIHCGMTLEEISQACAFHLNGGGLPISGVVQCLPRDLTMTTWRRRPTAMRNIVFDVLSSVNGTRWDTISRNASAEILDAQTDALGSIPLLTA